MCVCVLNAFVYVYHKTFSTSLHLLLPDFTCLTISSFLPFCLPSSPLSLPLTYTHEHAAEVAYRATRYPSSPTGRSLSPPAPAPAINMSSFNSRDHPCFHGSCVVRYMLLVIVCVCACVCECVCICVCVCLCEYVCVYVLCPCVRNTLHFYSVYFQHSSVTQLNNGIMLPISWVSSTII